MLSGLDPIVYLRSLEPFRRVPEALFQAAVSDLEVAFFPAETAVVRAGGEPLVHLYVIRTGSVRRERPGGQPSVLEEGEVFGHISLMTGEATMDVTVEEPLLAYRIPKAGFQLLLNDASFASQFAAGLGERLRSSLEHSPVTDVEADLQADVERLLRGPAAWIGPEATVSEAARLMSASRISAVLVRTEPPGIVTDRDFRSRVLAAGRGPETRVTEVSSQPLTTVSAGAPIHHAWMTLLDAGVHHLPVVRGDRILGIITDTDLLRCPTQGPVGLLRRVERLSSREVLPGYGALVAEMTGTLLAAGLDPGLIAGFVARLNDALLVRILDWAEAELGPAPAPYAWIAFGSEGRMEQTLLTDQDNALVFADEGQGARGWYRALAERTNADLVAAGFPSCPGGYMASRWHGSLSEWSERFAGWIDSPVPQALLEAAIFFDFRRIAGTLDLAPLESVLAQAPEKPVFLRFLARSALSFRPPLALLLRVRGASSRVDLKLQGISAIVFLARCYGLEAATRARGTAERLRAAVAAGLLDGESADLAEEAYRFLLGLRLRLQLRGLARHVPPSNEVAIQDLSAVERTRLKEAFRAIRSWQEQAAHHFQTTF